MASHACHSGNPSLSLIDWHQHLSGSLVRVFMVFSHLHHLCLKTQDHVNGTAKFSLQLEIYLIPWITVAGASAFLKVSADGALPQWHLSACPNTEMKFFFNGANHLTVTAALYVATWSATVNLLMLISWPNYTYSLSFYFTPPPPHCLHRPE